MKTALIIALEYDGILTGWEREQHEELNAGLPDELVMDMYSLADMWWEVNAVLTGMPR